jgi:glycerol-3-phosphate acyltransferase PlsY
MFEVIQWIGVALGAYVLGAIPMGWLIAGARRGDLLTQGSGKIGTANALSVLGRRAALVVFVLDLLKGAIPVALTGLLPWPDSAWRAAGIGIAGAAAIAGHNWSVWMRLLAGRWQGGRGIMPAFGGLLALHPLLALAALLGAALGAGLTRYMVIGTLTGMVATLAATGALVAAGTLPGGLLVVVAVWVLVVLVGFADSLARLAQGREPRIGQGT